MNEVSDSSWLVKLLKVSGKPFVIFFCQKKTIKRKDRNMEFEMFSEVLNQSADVFSKHTADIGSFNFVEYGI